MRVPPKSTVALRGTPSSHFVPATLDARIAYGHARLVDGATLTELDGTPIVQRPRRPIGIGRTGVLAICAVAIAVDLALRLLSVLPSWSGYESAGVLPMMLTNMIGGVVAFLLPAAFMLRSPDAWQARRMLLLGALLGAGSELAHSAGAAVSALAVLQFNAGAATTWPSFMPDADVVSRIGLLVGLLAGAVGTLLFAFGLARLRERSAARSSRGVIAVALVVVGLVGLWGFWPRVAASAGALGADWAWTVPALQAAGFLAWLYRAWVILTGWSAGEAPRRAWTWAAAATSVGLAFFASGYLLGFLGPIGLDPGLSVTALTVVGIGAGLLFVAAVADGLGASPARE
jgi:hypothetical protein